MRESFELGVAEPITKRAALRAQLIQEPELELAKALQLSLISRQLLRARLLKRGKPKPAKAPTGHPGGHGGNPNHDKIGRFSSGPGDRVGSKGGPGRLGEAGDAGTISSTQPGRGGKAGSDPNKLWYMGIDHVLDTDPAYAQKMITSLSAVAGFEDLGHMEVGKALHEAVKRIKNNVVSMAKDVPAADAKAWAEWYPRAHAFGAELAKRYGLAHPTVAYAVIARLSPSANWYGNLAVANEVMRIHHDDPVIEPAHLQQHRAIQMAQAVYKAKKTKTDVVTPEAPLDQGLVGKKFSELDDETAAELVRAISDVQGGGITNMDDKFQPCNKDGKTGRPAKARWQAIDNLTRSIHMLREPTREVINEEMGAQHKIRSFYNNMRDPYDPQDDVTIDSHALGIAIGIPVSSSSPEISTKRGGYSIYSATSSTASGIVGTYPIFVDAYRAAAKELGYDRPNALQSVVWEHWRKQWPEGARDGWMVDTVRNVHRGVAGGMLTREAGDQIIESFRTQLPGLPGGGGTNKPEAIEGPAAQFIPQEGERTKHAASTQSAATRAKPKAKPKAKAVKKAVPEDDWRMALRRHLA